MVVLLVMEAVAVRTPMEMVLLILVIKRIGRTLILCMFTESVKGILEKCIASWLNSQIFQIQEINSSVNGHTAYEEATNSNHEEYHLEITQIFRTVILIKSKGTRFKIGSFMN